MSELKARTARSIANEEEMLEMGSGESIEQLLVYPKSEADKVIAEKNEEIVGLRADYKEACDRLQTAGLIKDEQKAKADKLLSCLKYLVMRDLIKDCPSKKVATEIVKEYDNGL